MTVYYSVYTSDELYLESFSCYKSMIRFIAKDSRITGGAVVKVTQIADDGKSIEEIEYSAYSVLLAHDMKRRLKRKGVIRND